MKHALSQYNMFGMSIINNISILGDILLHAVQDPATGTIVVFLNALDECKNPLLSITEPRSLSNTQVGKRLYTQLFPCNLLLVHFQS